MKLPKKKYKLPFKRLERVHLMQGYIKIITSASKDNVAKDFHLKQMLFF